MDEFTATEVAFKNGYNQALRDFVEMLKNKADLISVNDFEFKRVISSDELDQIVKELERE